MSQLYLVSCVAKKAPAPATAADLYRSAWFLKARSFVERRGARWLELRCGEPPGEFELPPTARSTELEPGWLR